MHSGSKWAEPISSKIWSAPISGTDHESFRMDVDWEKRRGLQCYLSELWHGFRYLTKRVHAYSKVKQG